MEATGVRLESQTKHRWVGTVASRADEARVPFDCYYTGSLTRAEEV